MIAHNRMTADPHATTAVIHVGREHEPVVIVDGAFGPLAEELVAQAATRTRFEPAATIGSHYPGLVGPLPTAYVDAMVSLALSLLAAQGGGAVRPVRARGNFSLVTTPPDALSPEQRVPHVDAADRMQFAAVHYLARDDAQGTGFFRHRATGYETVSAERWAAYRAVLEPDLGDRAGYALDHDAVFERIGAVEARFDRLILYRACLLHSGLIAAVPRHAGDPRRGRLTGNLFLTCAAA